MRNIYFCICAFMSVLPALAQQPERRDEGRSAVSGTAATPIIVRAGNQAYASVIAGNGAAYGKGITEDRSMQWRTFEVRFGREVAWPKNLTLEQPLRLDLIYYNEGHPENNHRDGFGLQMIYRKSLHRRLNLELGAGPYYSMNTTTINRIEYNDPRLGVLFSLAFLFELERLYPGMHIRLGINHVTMPGAHSSNALMVGVGRNFDYPPYRPPPADAVNPAWLSVAVLTSQTNHGHTNNAVGILVDAKKYYGYWAGSISGIVEGDDGIRVDRQGIAAQGWFVQPLDERWALSAGFGPYLAKNKRDADDPLVHGLFSIQVDRLMHENWKIFARFNRVNTFRNRNDRDLFSVGLMRRFGG